MGEFHCALRHAACRSGADTPPGARFFHAERLAGHVRKRLYRAPRRQEPPMNFPAADALDTPSMPGGADGAPRPTLVAFAALRWGEDVQRPQQLLTRIAKHYRVVVVEPPLATHRDAYLESTTPAPGLEVLTPHTRVPTAGFHDGQWPTLRRLLADFVRARAIERPLAWLYTPRALPLVDDLDPRAVVYDCVRHAAHDDLRDEARLLAQADVVIAAGPSLYQGLRARHPNVHCVANAVDAAHFAPASLAGSSIPAISARAIHASMRSPRLGYFGVIDERIDLALLARLADGRPDWQIVLAGPVVGLAEQALPRRANLHWLGPQTYAIRPHLQSHWDLCLLPFRCDETARHAAPIEALEFLAGQKSVVGTPVPDVVALYGHVVRLAPADDGFIEACRAALCERGPLRRQRRIDALIAVHSCSWDRAAERVRRLLIEFARDTAAVPAERVGAVVRAKSAGASRHAPA
jgi:UDP-galactopyranose mutase